MEGKAEVVHLYVHTPVVVCVRVFGLCRLASILMPFSGEPPCSILGRLRQSQVEAADVPDTEMASEALQKQTKIRP